jgi:hypothetical protein
MRARIVLLNLAGSLLLACSSTPDVEPPPVGSAAALPPQNPTLAAGLCPLVHCDSYQSDALPVRGAEQPSRALGEAEIDLFWTSPISAGVLDRSYPDGSTVLWAAKVDRILKLGFDAGLRLVPLAELPLPTGRYPAHSADFMRQWIAELDALPLASAAYRAKAAYWRDYPLEALHAYSALLDREGVLYVAARDRILAYADAETGKARSAIVKRGEFVLDPAQLNGGPAVLIGLSASFDGTLVAASLDGSVVAVDRALTRASVHRFPGERIWNSLAVDELGGVYVVTDKKLHKLIWTGQGWSDRPDEGAWSEAYESGENDRTLRGSRGSGTAPTLVGTPSDRDRFVLIADAADVNHMVLYWRDAIPKDWKKPKGVKSRRVAGRVPLDFGLHDVRESYAENSAVALGYGALVANGRPRNGMALQLDNQLWINEPSVAPLGVQKFAWDAKKRRFASAWARPDLSNPNVKPVIAAQSRLVHCVSARDGAWALETLDWDSGATRAVYTLGPSQRFNPIQLSMSLLGNGDPILSTFGGVLHLKIGAPPASEPLAGEVVSEGPASPAP